MTSVRPARPVTRSITSAALAGLTILSVAGCAAPSDSAPATTVSSESVSPACLTALREAFDGALYRPGDTVERLPECASASEKAIGEAAEQILRTAFASPSPSPSR